MIDVEEIKKAQNLIQITVNGVTVKAEEGTTIYNASKACGIEIPTICYLEDLPAHGSCRICVVEVEGQDKLLRSCATPIAEGMVIHTHSEKTKASRKASLERTIDKHEIECFNCKKIGNCKLQEYSDENGVVYTPQEKEKIYHEIDTKNKFFDFDRNKCILCMKCINTCGKLQINNAISLVGKGKDAHIEIDPDKCVSCGNCVSNCPVGALIPKKAVSAIGVKKTLTTCPYCGVGCQMNIVSKNGSIVDVDPARGEANEGLLCVKGKFGYKYVSHPDRLTTPLIKKDGIFVESTWEEAFTLIASKIKETKEKHGSNALAGLSSAKCTTEDNYVFQKMMRAAIKTNNVDHCARLCHASTVAGLAITLGSGAMTNTVKEIKKSDVLLVTGSNTTEAHPVIATKMKQAVRNGSKIIVVDPRRIALVDHAELFVQIKPGTNIAFFNSVLSVIVEEGLADEEYIAQRTENFDSIKELLSDYTPEKVAKICNVEPEEIRKVARLYGNAERAGIYYAMGVTQFSTGTKGVFSLSNLALATGNLGKEGTGINPLRGQNNVQGSSDMCAAPSHYPGYQHVTNPEVVKNFEKSWGVDNLPSEVGLTATEIIDEAGKSIKLLYIMGENPMVSDPDITHVKHSLEQLDFLVVQDIFMTETANLADVVLPATTQYEKEGTITNTERRIQRVRKVVDAPGLARADWEILSEITRRIGYENKFTSPSEIMDEIATVNPAYGGVNYERLENIKGLQWPCPSIDHEGTRFLHESKFTRAGGKATFMPAEYTDPKEVPDNDYPLIFTTGRVLYHWHTRSMTGRVEGLHETVPKSYIEIHPEDAKKLGIVNDELVKVSSRRGELTTNALITRRVDEQVIFMPFHFAESAANLLTNTVIDDIAKIPELKVCSCRVEKIK
jgi:formate dehydrogenase (NAD+, ferredoxin) subunit